MPRRVFDLPATHRSDEDAIEFTIGDQRYRCVDDLPANAVYLLVTEEGTPAAIAFIRGCLPSGDTTDRFDAQLARKESGVIVTQGVLSEVMDWLLGAYAERPTSPLASLPGGRQATTDSSPPAAATTG